MGYTHYWTQRRDFTEGEMLQIGEGVKAIIAAAVGNVYPNNYNGEPAGPLVICGGDGTGEPEITEKRIAFNGTDEGDLGHETLGFNAVRVLPYAGAAQDRLGWDCCKTAHKPYDVVVTAALTFLYADWDFDVSSDGDVGDWEAGVKLAEEALGREFANPLVVEALVG